MSFGKTGAGCKALTTMIQRYFCNPCGTISFGSYNYKGRNINIFRQVVQVHEAVHEILNIADT